MQLLLDDHCEKTIFIIAGVTASEKSDLAREVAELFGGIIINADSKQIYKFIPIITAQPNDLLDKNFYRLYSYWNLDQEYSVMQWIDDVVVELNEVFIRDKIPILLGGTGMYISSIVNGISNFPKISHETRLRVAENFSFMGRVSFYRHYLLKDKSIINVDVNDTYRLIKAVEVFEETGLGLQDWYKAYPMRKIFNNIKLFLIVPDAFVTREKIVVRFENMIKNGVIDEIEQLKKMNLVYTKASKTIYGISEISEYLDGKISLEEAKMIILKKTMQYAKRQRTWFNNQYKNAKRFTDVSLAKCDLISSIGSC